MMRWILAAALMAAIGCPASASAAGTERGWIRGTVATEDGESLPFANLEVLRLVAPSDTLGYRIGRTVTAVPSGEFSIEVEPGSYRIVASYVSCLRGSIMPVRVEPGQVTPVQLRLRRRSIQLASLRVRGSRVRSSAEAVLAQQRLAPAVSDALSSEQMRKAPDGNAAEALHRVTGLSTVDSRYVFVRGLGERYSSTLINEAPVSSPEPNRRVVPLDLIPAALLDNIFIQKTYTPDQPAEFGGGTVNIHTRDFPGHRFFSISLSGGTVDRSGQGAFLEYRGGKWDFLGMDDGTRALPELAQELAGDQRVAPGGVGSETGFTRDQIAAMGRTFNKIWTATRRTPPPDYGISAAYGDEFLLLGRPLGFLFGGVFRNAFRQDRHEENTYDPDEGGALSPRTHYDVCTSQMKAQLSGLANLAYRVGENTRVRLSTLYNRAAEDEYRFYEGPNEDHGARLRDTRLRFLARSIWASSLSADHALPRLGGSTIEWRITHSAATMDEPDRREYEYEWRPDEEGEGGRWELSVRSASMGFTRMYGELDERERGFAVEWVLPFRLHGGDSRLRAGYQESQKDREAAYRRLAFMSPSSGGWDRTLPPESLMVDSRIGGTPREFRLTELTRATDAYTARFESRAPYLIADLALVPRLRLLTGVRLESWLQTVETFDPFIPGENVVPAKLKERDVLPCANLTYALRPTVNLRAAFSQTISRPDLRELTPFELSQYESGWVMQGNPELKRARLRNYDLRGEAFFGSDELLALSFFYKDLTDPIEMTLRLAGAALRQVPENGSGGRLYGTELEARLRLRRLAHRLAAFMLVGNLTQVQSKTELDKEGWHTTLERPLAGQSPYLLNLMLFYDAAERGFGGSLLYSRYGERLDGVGVGGMPDIYERAHGTLDSSLWVSWMGMRWSLTASNMLAGELRWMQGDYVIRSTRKGRGFGFSISRSG